MSAWELSGLAAVLEARPSVGVQRVAWCCAVAVCWACREAFNPLEVACGSVICARCQRELGNPGRARCLPCASAEMQCVVKEPLERAVVRALERVRGAA